MPVPYFSVCLSLSSLFSLRSTDRYYRTQAVFVSPLLNGTGIATKIFNAVVKGMPVVTTPLGLNGLGLTVDQADGRIAVSSDPDGFAQAVVGLMNDPKKWVSQTRAALEYLQVGLLLVG